MLNYNWLLICFEMMCDYFPKSYVYRDEKRKFLLLSEHFLTLERQIEHRISADSKVFFYRTIGRGYSKNELHEKALPYFKKASDLLLTQDEGNILLEDVIKTHFCVAECLMNLDDYDEAIKYADLVVGYLSNNDFYKNGYYNYMFIAFLYRAKIYRFFGEDYYLLSKENYMKALELETIILKNHYDEHFIDVVAAHIGLAIINVNLGCYEEVEEHLNYSCKMIEGKHGNDSPEEYAYIFYDIGCLFESFDEIDKALLFFTRALKIEETLFFDDNYPISLTLQKLSSIYEHKNNVVRADYYKSRTFKYKERERQ